MTSHHFVPITGNLSILSNGAFLHQFSINKNTFKKSNDSLNKAYKMLHKPADHPLKTPATITPANYIISNSSSLLTGKLSREK